MNGRLRFQSFQTEFARSQGESEFPGLWRGLETIHSPALGIQGRKIFDTKQKLDSSFDTGMLSNDAAWKDGVFNGNSIYYDGSSNCRTSTISRTWGFSVNCSICAWIRTTDSDSCIVSLGRGDAVDEALLFVNTSKATIFNHKALSNYSFRSSDTSIDNGKWNFVVGCINGDYTNLKIFVNGKQETGTYGEVGSPSDISDSTARILRFGGRVIVTTQTENFVGNIGDVLVYSRVLSNQEITQLYYGQTPLVKKLRRNKINLSPEGENCFGQILD